MKMKKLIFKFAGIPGEAHGGFEKVMLYLAVVISLTMASISSVIINSELGFRTPLIPLAVFFLMKFIVAAEGDWIIYAPIKAGFAAVIYFVDMPAIHNGWWYLWAFVVALFVLSALIDLIACIYDFLDRRKGIDPRAGSF